MKFSVLTLRHYIFIMFKILSTSLIAVFVYDLLNNTDSSYISNYTTTTNNYINNNHQQFVRTIENSTSTITSNNSKNVTFPDPIKTIHSPLTIAVVVLASLAGGFFATKTKKKNTQTQTQTQTQKKLYLGFKDNQESKD